MVPLTVAPLPSVRSTTPRSYRRSVSWRSRRSSTLTELSALPMPLAAVAYAREGHWLLRSGDWRIDESRSSPRQCGYRLSRGGAAARPQALNALQGLAFRFRDVQVDEGRGEHAHDPVYPVGETVIEQVVEDRISVENLEGPGNEQVGDPLGGDRDGKGTVLDRVRKHLREQHPGYRSPRQRKPGAVNHHRAQRAHPNQPGLEQEAERQHRDGHNQCTDDEQRLSSPAIDSQDGNDRGQRVCETDDDRLPERCVRGRTHVLEHQRCVVQYRVDADELLEDGKHDAGHDDA